MDSAGLFLIGLGPGSLDLMTQRAIQLLKEMDIRLLEGYTATLPLDSEEDLEMIIGPWKRVMRPEIEEPKQILEMAQTQKVGIMVVGDPMQATTHVDLLLRAKNHGIKTAVVPGISATTLAITLSGLQSYRFGRQVTLPYPYGEYLPTSPLEYILDNKARNLHSLVLLDLDPTGQGIDSPIHMSPFKAAEIIRQMSRKRENGIEDISNWFVIVLSDLGTEQCNIYSTKISGIRDIDGGRIHCLILPASMDELEMAVFENMALDTQR